jgi:hypothetical protein
MIRPLPVGESRESARRDAKTAKIFGFSRLYLMDGLPPVTDTRRLELELGLVPSDDREDAVQVAWIAHLSGADAAVAVNSWWSSVRRQRKRERTNEI